MRNFYFKFVLVVVLLILPACGASSDLGMIGEPSQAVRLGEDSSLFALSESFAKQLAAFNFEFGNFSTAPEFIDLIPVETAKVEILKDDLPILTVFELQLSGEISYEDLITQIQSEIPEGKLNPAVFGADSFYFLQDASSINILPFGNSVLAFQFAAQDFDEVRDFISSLLIFR